MFEFEKNCEVLCVEEKLNKKNERYYIVRILSENSTSIDLIYRGTENLSFVTGRNVYKCKLRFVHNSRYNTNNLDLISIASSK